MTLSSVVFKFASVVFITVFLHWGLVNAYVHFCSPFTLLGPIKTFLSLGSPVCHTINLVQCELAKHYITIWSGAGLAIIGWGIKTLSTSSENPK